MSSKQPDKLTKEQLEEFERLLKPQGKSSTGVVDFFKALLAIMFYILVMSLIILGLKWTWVKLFAGQ